ncbi:MAG: BlaI/MecI/CopY family transcriptional regulator [Acidobacteria bacterium]|nr:BlaI/MecI/CopY family transcriptional regulator [Acidobacteriota bacterium]
MTTQHTVSRRERQILDALFRLREATAAEIQTALPDAPSYSAVRALLRIMEDKGHVRHREDGPRYVYLPAAETASASRSALRHVLDTFFEGSAAGAMAALLDDDAAKLSREELDRMQELIAKARKGGR